LFITSDRIKDGDSRVWMKRQSWQRFVLPGVRKLLNYFHSYNVRLINEFGERKYQDCAHGAKNLPVVGRNGNNYCLTDDTGSQIMRPALMQKYEMK